MLCLKSKEELFPKKNVTLSIWQYFRFKPDVKGEPISVTQVILKLCTRAVLVKKSQTTNLYRHLHVHHLAKVAKLPPKKAAVSKDPSQPSIIRAHNPNHIHSINYSYEAQGAAVASRTEIHGKETGKQLCNKGFKIHSSLVLINGAQRGDILLHQKYL